MVAFVFYVLWLALSVNRFLKKWPRKKIGKP